jgi:hypothetical protein
MRRTRSGVVLGALRKAASSNAIRIGRGRHLQKAGFKTELSPVRHDRQHAELEQLSRANSSDKVGLVRESIRTVQGASTHGERVSEGEQEHEPHG